MEVTPLQILEAIDALLDSPERWTQNAYARTAQRSKCASISSAAVCWCLSGALIKVEHDLHLDIVQINDAEFAITDALRVASGTPFISLPEFNDFHTFEEVKALISKAKEHLSRDPQESQPQGEPEKGTP